MSNNVSPGQLDPSLIGMQSPTSLPDPQGLDAIINALASADMFRDMSGLDEARALASQALQEAQSGATSTGQQASTNLANGLAMQSQAIQKILSMYEGLSNSIANAGFSALTGAKSGIASKDISAAGAIFNKASELDAEPLTNQPGTTGADTSNGAPTTGVNTEMASLGNAAIEGLIAGLPFSAGNSNNGDTQFAQFQGGARSRLNPLGEELEPNEVELGRTWPVNAMDNRTAEQGEYRGVIFSINPDLHRAVSSANNVSVTESNKFLTRMDKFITQYQTAISKVTGMPSVPFDVVEFESLSDIMLYRLPNNKKLEDAMIITHGSGAAFPELTPSIFLGDKSYDANELLAAKTQNPNVATQYDSRGTLTVIACGAGYAGPDVAIYLRELFGLEGAIHATRSDVSFGPDGSLMRADFEADKLYPMSANDWRRISAKTIRVMDTTDL